MALTLDGTGHGDDGTAWGGEVLYADLEHYERVGHLETIPLLGSEKALYDLRRLNFAINNMKARKPDFRTNEAASWKLMDRVSGILFAGYSTRSSFRLGVCRERTYEATA